MLSAYAGKLQSIKELRYYGARYDISDKGGSTALHWAVDGGNTELIEWMIDDGADICAKDHNGWTPFLRTGIHAAVILWAGSSHTFPTHTYDIPVSLFYV